MARNYWHRTEVLLEESDRFQGNGKCRGGSISKDKGESEGEGKGKVKVKVKVKVR